MSERNRHFYHFDDCLWILRVLGSDICHYKIAKRMIKFTLFVQVFVVLFHIYFFLTTFDSNLFLRFFPVASFSNYANVNLLQLTFSGSFISKDREEYWNFLLPIDNAGRKVESKIKNESKIVNAIAVLNFTLMLASTISHLIPNKNDEYFFLVDYYLNHHELFASTALYIIYRLSGLMLIYCMIVGPCQICYNLQHIKYQMYLLRDDFEKIDEIRRNHPVDYLVGNDDYQKEIFEKFLVCVKRYQTICQFVREKNKEINAYIIPLSISGCFHGIGAMIYLVNCINQEVYARALITIALFGSLFGSLIQIGQFQLEECEALRDSVNGLNWYCWNLKNRKIYLMVLQLLSEPYVFNFKGISINYALGVPIVKMIYKVISLFVQLRIR